MILNGAVCICRHTAERLAAGAREHGLSVNHHASIAVEAAARVGGTAIPALADERRSPVVTVHLSIASRWLVVIADAAINHDMILEVQIRAILDAAVKNYVAEPLVANAAPPPPRPKAIPRLPPFDPAYYAKHGAAFK